jgi:hypothetical protein
LLAAVADQSASSSLLIDFSGANGHHARTCFRVGVPVMVRYSAAVLALFLSACATTPPAPTAAEAALQSDCDAGGAQSCMALVQADQEKRNAQIAASTALMGYAASLQQPVYRPQTTCMAMGTMISCY